MTDAADNSITYEPGDKGTQKSSGYALVLFDLDGTLIDTSPGIFASLKRCFDDIGHPEFKELDLSRFIGPPLSTSFESFCGLIGNDNAEAIRVFRSYYGKTGVFECELYDGMAETLDALAAAGVRLGVSTCKLQDFAEKMLAHLGIADRFDCIVGALADDSRKTKVDVIAGALEATGIGADSAIMIGDTASDISGAHECGVAGMAALYGFGDNDVMLAEKPEYTVERAGDIAPALGCRLGASSRLAPTSAPASTSTQPRRDLASSRPVPTTTSTQPRRDLASSRPVPTATSTQPVHVITGPTGAVGMALARYLLARGDKVVVVANPSSARADRLRDLPGARMVTCDISELGKLPELIGCECETFFHLAWKASAGAKRNDWYAQTENIRYCLDAVHAASELHCKTFVGAGSQAEYGPLPEGVKCAPDTPCNPKVGYGMAKLCAGQMTRALAGELGIRHLWPRILSAYGPYDGSTTMISSSIECMLDGQRCAFTAGEQLWDFLYADDVASALVAVAERGRDGAIYCIGSGYAHPLANSIRAMRDAVDPTLPLGLGEIPYGAGQVMYLCADTDALTRDTGWQSAIPFETGIARTVAWHRAQRDASRRSAEGEGLS